MLVSQRLLEGFGQHRGGDGGLHVQFTRVYGEQNGMNTTEFTIKDIFSDDWWPVKFIDQDGRETFSLVHGQ